MKRLTAAVTAILTIMLFLCLPAHAVDGRLTLEYVPRAERGTVFYLDISYDGTLSAATLELSYDGAAAEYREIGASASTSTVKTKAENGVVKIVFGDSAGVSGRLCRLTFKALSGANAAFTLRMTEGVDGGLNRIGAITPATLTAAPGGSYSSKSGSSGSAYSGSKSDKTYVPPDSTEYDGDGSSRDLYTPNARKRPSFAMLAAAAVLLTLILGFFIGRRSLLDKKKPADPPEEKDAQDESGSE